MQNIKQLAVTLLIVAAVLFGVYKVVHVQKATPSVGDGRSIFVLFKSPDVGSSTVITNASTLIVATNTSRGYVAVVNDSANTVYLGVGSPAVLGKGIRLNANGGAFEMDPNGIFSGAIYGISTATSAVTYLEGNAQ